MYISKQVKESDRLSFNCVRQSWPVVDQTQLVLLAEVDDGAGSETGHRD